MQEYGTSYIGILYCKEFVKMGRSRSGDGMFWILVMNLLALWTDAHSTSFANEVIEEKSWIEEDLLDFPQLAFEFQFHVSFPITSCCPILDISSYNRAEHTESECFHESVKNELVWYRGVYALKPAERDQESEVTCTAQNDAYNCTVNDKTLYFEPKKTRYLIGYECSDERKSLKGMKYRFNFTTISNTTTCEPVDVSLLSIPCSDYFLWTSFPNILGHKNQHFASTVLDIVTTVIESLKDPTIEPCYEHVGAFLCGLFFPPCTTWEFDRNQLPNSSDDTAVNGSTIVVDKLLFPCKEMCEEFASGCISFLHPIITITYCEYFPQFNESDTCIWDKVTCPNPPPTVKNATVVGGVTKNYTIGTLVEYQCDNKYSLKGSANVTCKPSGNWDEVPGCISDADSDTSLEIIIPVSVLALIAIIITVVTVFYIKRKRRRLAEENVAYPKRNRQYDAFVSYFSEGSNEDRLFVRRILQPRMEEQTLPPFRLFFHERNFRADRLIYANILDAINKSNCAIVIMSQEYVNSRWCREEFEEIMEEQKKDPAYRLFVIMRQEHKTLKNCSIYMNKYFRSKTYFEDSDIDLWAKIERELTELQGDGNVTEVTV